MANTTRRRTRSGTPSDPTKVIGYVRVSTGEQALGPKAQRTFLLAWCEAHRCKLIELVSDQGIGGAAPAEQRPGLSAALAGVKQHGTGALLVATRDRLARDTLVAALVEQRVQKLGATIRAVDRSANADNSEGLLVRRIVDAFAEYERLTIQARTKLALAVKRLRRERISRQPPYGWRFSRDRKHLVPEPREQATVRLAQQLRRRRGLSLRRMAQRLAKRGHTPRAAKRWHPETIASITQRTWDPALKRASG
jgi:DNA invertase Pin-like site-specific DNA recombinase